MDGGEVFLKHVNCSQIVPEHIDKELGTLVDGSDDLLDQRQLSLVNAMAASADNFYLYEIHEKIMIFATDFSIYMIFQMDSSARSHCGLQSSTRTVADIVQLENAPATQSNHCLHIWLLANRVLVRFVWHGTVSRGTVLCFTHIAIHESFLYQSKLRRSEVVRLSVMQTRLRSFIGDNKMNYDSTQRHENR